MSPDQAALSCFLVCSVVMADPAAPVPEKIVFLVAAALLSFSVMREVERQHSGVKKNAVSWALEMSSVFAFLGQLALVGYRFLVLK